VDYSRITEHRGPALDLPTFRRLRERITATSGILVLEDENSRFLLERRLQHRLRFRGVVSFAEYEALIDDAEMESVLDTVAVHETYFFREKRQLTVFTDRLLPELTGRRGPIRIWSAGCSTGEEAYTIAMLLAERGLLEHARSRLFATDLSRRVIEAGKRGVYGPGSFRTTEEELKQRYSEDAGWGMRVVCEPLRMAVEFGQSNLIEPPKRREAQFSNGEVFDVVFCRNVVMYFDEEAALKTLRLLWDALAPGGYLLVGHAESLLPPAAGFRAVQYGRELVHRKPVS
jgi:chemotaxis protein methyltransferase CheR